MKKCGTILAGVFISAAALVFVIKITVCLLAVFLFSSSPPKTPPASLGDYRHVAHCTHYSFQDGIEYDEYHYSQVSLTDNAYFQSVTPDNIEEIRSFVDSYESLVRSYEDYPKESAQALYQSYSYESSTLSAGDYYYLRKGDPKVWWDDIDLFVFDLETMRLYHLKVSL